MVHTTDVAGMLEGMTPQQFALWCAYDRIDPLGNQGLCDVMANFAVAVCRWAGMEVDQSHFMRWIESAGPTAEQVASPNQAAQMVKGLVGATTQNIQGKQ